MIWGAIRFLALPMQILVGVSFFSSRLPRRPKPLVGTCAVLMGYLLTLFLVFRSWNPFEPENQFFAQLITFSAFLLACVLLVLVWHKATLLSALFCATAGYTSQNLASGLDGLVKLLALTFWGIPEDNVALWTISFLVCSFVVYVPVFLLFVQNMRSIDLDRAQHRGMLWVLVVVMLVVIVFDVMNKMLPVYQVPLPIVCTLRIIHGVVCVFVLYAEYEMVYNRQLQLDVAVTEQVLVERGRQYELSRETIEAVNRRVHDIRHKVLRELDAADVDRETLVEVAHAVDVYDAAIYTGSEALDTTLTEKGLLCKREGITLTSIADGTSVSFVAAADIYTLVTALLDVAIAAVREVEDPERRTISLVIRPTGGMATLHVECFCAHDVQLLADSPVTSVAERYDGLVVTDVTGGVLSLDVALPLPA